MHSSWGWLQYRARALPAAENHRIDLARERGLKRPPLRDLASTWGVRKRLRFSPEFHRGGDQPAFRFPDCLPTFSVALPLFAAGRSA